MPVTSSQTGVTLVSVPRLQPNSSSCLCRLTVEQLRCDLSCSDAADSAHDASTNIAQRNGLQRSTGPRQQVVSVRHSLATGPGAFSICTSDKTAFSKFCSHLKAAASSGSCTRRSRRATARSRHPVGVSPPRSGTRCRSTPRSRSWLCPKPVRKGKVLLICKNEWHAV